MREIKDVGVRNVPGLAAAVAAELLCLPSIMDFYLNCWRYSLAAPSSFIADGLVVAYRCFQPPDSSIVIELDPYCLPEMNRIEAWIDSSLRIGSKPDEDLDAVGTGKPSPWRRYRHRTSPSFPASGRRWVLYTLQKV